MAEFNIYFDNADECHAAWTHARGSDDVTVVWPPAHNDGDPNDWELIVEADSRENVETLLNDGNVTCECIEGPF